MTSYYWVCAACQTPNAIGVGYCRACGRSRNAADPPALPDAIASAPGLATNSNAPIKDGETAPVRPPAIVVPVPAVRCPDCAEDVGADAARCPYCEHRFDASRLAYCETCDRRVEPMVDGRCPTCGNTAADASRVARRSGERDGLRKVATDFTALVVAVDDVLMHQWAYALDTDDVNIVRATVSRTMPTLWAMKMMLRDHREELVLISPLESFTNYSVAIDFYVDAGNDWLAGDFEGASAAMGIGQQFWERAVDVMDAALRG